MRRHGADAAVHAPDARQAQVQLCDVQPIPVVPYVRVDVGIGLQVSCTNGRQQATVKELVAQSISTLKNESTRLYRRHGPKAVVCDYGSVFDFGANAEEIFGGDRRSTCSGGLQFHPKMRCALEMVVAQLHRVESTAGQVEGRRASAHRGRWSRIDVGIHTLLEIVNEREIIQSKSDACPGLRSDQEDVVFALWYRQEGPHAKRPEILRKGDRVCAHLIVLPCEVIPCRLRWRIKAKVKRQRRPRPHLLQRGLSREVGLRLVLQRDVASGVMKRFKQMASRLCRGTGIGGLEAERDPVTRVGHIIAVSIRQLKRYGRSISRDAGVQAISRRQRRRSVWACRRDENAKGRTLDVLPLRGDHEVVPAGDDQDVLANVRAIQQIHNSEGAQRRSRIRLSMRRLRYQ
eukprot:scaffold2262_cov262-Pinguiococcus_pyrenoidosus.AAC.1